MVPPPYFIAYLVDQAAPGIWPRFVAAANGALQRNDTVTSWWRSPGKNQAVGGSPDSQHLAALAFDATGPNLARLEGSLRAAGFRVVRYQGHVHAQAAPAGWARSSGLLDRLGV